MFLGVYFWLQNMWDLSSLTRDQTHVPCIGRQILNHCTTGEVPGKPFQQILLEHLDIYRQKHNTLHKSQLRMDHGLKYKI